MIGVSRADMRETADLLWSFYGDLLHKGFSPQQAFELTKVMLRLQENKQSRGECVNG